MTSAARNNLNLNYSESSKDDNIPLRYVVKSSLNNNNRNSFPRHITRPFLRQLHSPVYFSTHECFWSSAVFSFTPCFVANMNHSFDQFFHHWHLSIRLDEQSWLPFLLKGMSKFSRINGRWTAHVFKTSLVSYNSLKCKFTSNKKFLSMGQALCHVTINDPISQ